jgi:hypothetical protein
MSKYKKYGIVLVIGLSLSVGGLRAQSVSQLLTQLALDVQKLSELKTILNDMYTSYTILDKGYTDIKDIAEGNFNLHKAYLDGLLAVSPALGNYYKVAGIINTEITIVSEYKAAATRYSSGPFTVQEVGYITGVYSALLQRSAQSIEALTLVITAGQLRMSDAERLQSVDEVYSDVNGQLGFLRRFNNGLDVQAVQRVKEQNDLNSLKQLYGLPGGY